MKQKLLNSIRLRLLMLLAVLVSGINAAWGETTYKLQQVTSVTGGHYYVFEQDGYVMKNTISSNALQCTSTFKTTGLTGTETYVWRLLSATGGFNMTCSSGTLSNASSTTLSFGSTNIVWSFNFQPDGTVRIQNNGNSNRFLGFTSADSHAYRAYATSNLSSDTYPHAIKVYELVEEESKSPIGTFDTIDDMDLNLNDMEDFNPADFFTKDGGASGSVSFTVTPGDSESDVAYYESETILAIGAGSQEFTVTATPAVSDSESYEEVTTTFTVNVTDNRTAVESITAISPTTVYIGAIDDFELTEDHSDRVASYEWSSSEPSKLTLSDETYEALSAGDVNVTVTATPTDATTYKSVTVVFPVTVAYKYSSPAISKSSGEGDNFTTSTDVTLGTVSGATVYYTIDGTTPTNSSSVYSAPFAITATTTINAIAIDDGGLVSPVATATYTKVAEVKANISLSAGQTLSFTNFSEIGTYADPKSSDIIASDGNKYTMTGKQFGYYSSKLQMQKNTGELTSGTITSPNGFVLAVTASQNPPTVQFGSTPTAATSTSGNTKYYSTASTSTTFTLVASTVGATQITEITLTANKASNVITATTARSIDRTKSESTVTMDATSTSGTVTYAVKNSTLENEDYSLNTSTGVLTVTGSQSGVIVITASSASTSAYYAADDVDITVTVIGAKSDPTIVVSNVEHAYGSTYTLDISGFASGEVSLSSSKTAVATVAGLVITPVAVGTTTITVNTAESSLYNAGSETFTFTVTAPAGKTTGGKGATSTTATLDFTDNSTWGFPTSKVVDENSYNDGTYTVTLTGTTGNGYSFNTTEEYVILGQSGATLTFESFDKYVTKIDVVGRTGASGKVTQNIFVGSTAVSTETTGATGTNSYAIAEAYQAPGNIYTLKVTNGNNTQITSIKLYFTDVYSESVTLNGSGYATFCSLYPLDFTNYATADYSAWEVTGISESAGVYTITFNQLKGKIKGGQGILLKGTAGETVTIASCDSENTLGDNLLEGTTAPTYVTSGDYYGLSGENFVPVNTGTVKAGKALLDADWIPNPSLVKSFIFVFNDDATGITETRTATREEVEAIFNLGGQRLQKMQRGVNIVNGKKVLVK